jgi:hypothetical protein
MPARSLDAVRFPLGRFLRRIVSLHHGEHFTQQPAPWVCPVQVGDQRRESFG